MKVKVGIERAGDEARVAAVRAAVGPKTHLGVDANGGWITASNAIESIAALREHELKFVEQPVAASDLFGMAEVRAAGKLPIIADESVYTLQDSKNLARAAACDVFSIYIGKAGGIAPARDICNFAAEKGLVCTIGSNLELGIASAAMTHLGLATQAVAAETYACDIIGPLFYEDDILKEPMPIKGGEARVHEKPGLGVELNDAKVEKYRS
jgi:muconate cycloisomerase